MRPPRLTQTAAAAGLALTLWPAGADAQPRDGYNSTPRTFAGQVTRSADFLSPLDDGYRRPMPTRDTRYTYPAAATGGASLTDSVLDGIARDVGLPPIDVGMPRGFGSSAPPSGPPGPAGPPLTVVDPISERGFVSMMEIIGLPVVTPGGEAVGTIVSVGHDAAGPIAVVDGTGGPPLALPIGRLRLDRATGTVTTAW